MTLDEILKITKRNDDYCINNDHFCEQCPLGKRRCLRWYGIVNFYDTFELTSESTEERAIKVKEFLDGSKD